MQQSILHVSLLVKEYDEAIAFYCEKLKFTLVEDTLLDDKKRWVVVKPPGNSAASLVLAKANASSEKRQIGHQAGGRVFLFLCTDDFQRDYDQMCAAGVQFIRAPEINDYGRVAVFADLYGNLWDLLEPGPSHALYPNLNKAH